MLSFMRGIPCSGKLLGSCAKWGLLAQHRKALLRTCVCIRLGQGSRAERPDPRPDAAFASPKRHIWTPEGARRAGRTENSGRQVSVQRGQKEEASLSAAQKGGLFYVIFKELFSSSSPSKIYGDALEKCRAHPEVIGVFGEPIKGYGEATRRGRRQLVSHIEYVKDGLKYMRLKFYIEGSEKGKQGTVHLEVKENPESGKYEYRYIFVDIEVYPRRTIIVEDNR
ncbi:mitochondrial import inner membrane translocase subunit Tim21 isoform X2 [Podarcis muralis]